MEDTPDPADSQAYQVRGGRGKGVGLGVRWAGRGLEVLEYPQYFRGVQSTPDN